MQRLELFKFYFNKNNNLLSWHSNRNISHEETKRIHFYQITSQRNHNRLIQGNLNQRRLVMANTKESAVKPQEQFEEAYHLAEQATSEAVGAMKEHAKEKLEVGAENIQQATKSAENVIKERPLLSIGCAFLAGWAVSKLIK
ncbi:hypothetical protein D3Z63_13290 [Vibrio parahaemolyticus]|nr:hypothetical protein BGM07_025040 [Vibrio parahaemolyticus]QGG32055.1 hypothetical protein GH799_02405 [Vibrio parahaemolyticus 10329]ASZ53539.1 hypothetical protein YA91_24665 [Vibrio parahaemolyticus]AUT85729.1 hypothetical protein RK51_002030 [Vibrio parahaemolyticus]AVW93797.1 hypothetical protein DA442_00460 [Vibrio parahaemolyticus]